MDDGVAPPAAAEHGVRAAPLSAVRIRPGPPRWPRARLRGLHRARDRGWRGPAGSGPGGPVREAEGPITKRGDV